MSSAQDSSGPAATGVSRRAFLAGAGVAAGTAGTASVATAQEGQRRTVEMTDSLVFDPDSLTIAPGDTVVWENVGSIGHSVTAYAEEIPEDAEYFASGDFDAEQAARSAYTAGDPDSGDIAGGQTYEHTFEVVGTYGYFCIPHESAGMVGQITVQEGGPSEGGGGGPSIPELPEWAQVLGIASGIAFLSVMGLTYVFMRYGGDYVEMEG